MHQDDRTYAPELDPPEVVLRKQLEQEAVKWREAGLAPYIVAEKLKNHCLLLSHRLHRRLQQNALIILFVFVGVITGLCMAIFAHLPYCFLGGFTSLVCSFLFTERLANTISIAKQQMELECFKDREGLQH